jgi:ribosomal protection tetracycline resistance protein
LRTLNLGILAHVDAGKTSLTERLLHAAGVIDEIGSVDAGSTQTDSLALERQRGITIKSAVVSFRLDDLTVNLIDTPGHPDFIAEVERVLHVLDGAVLVVSAVEGVQPQTRVLLRTLRRLGIPTLIFVNKIDRTGADDVRVLRAIAATLTPDVIALNRAVTPGTREAAVTLCDGSDAAFGTRLTELLAEHDDTLLEAWLRADGGPLPPRLLRRELAAQTGRARVHPVFVGSAATGVGIDALRAGIRDLLPATDGRAEAGPVSGSVFKVERGAAGTPIAYLRLYSGAVHVRDVLRVAENTDRKVTALHVFDQGAAAPAAVLRAGQIAKVWGLVGVRVGDVVGVPTPGRAVRGHFAPPTLETVVEPCHTGERGALLTALTQLAEQDPLIGLRHDEVRQEIFVSLYGEVQKEVIEATLADEYGIAVVFRATTTLCVEQPTGTGSAIAEIKKDDNPFLAGLGLRVEPAPTGTGVRFEIGVELGSMPYAFFVAVEETVRRTLTQGLRGWPVRDCVVTVTFNHYWARQSTAHGGFDKSMSTTAGDFRDLTPLVLMDALRRAGTVVLEPMHRFWLDLPADALGATLNTLARLRAIPRAPTAHGPSYQIDGLVPAASVHELGQRLPTLTGGEGAMESTFDSYQPVTGAPPTRPRTDHNPLDRKEYLLRVVRRTLTG